MATSLHLEAANLPEDAIEVARIADAWGVKGWFKVVPHSADPEALFSAKRWFLQPSERGAKAAALALAQAGCRVTVCARTPEKAAALAARCGGVTVSWEDLPRAAAEHGLLLNATPLGMEGSPEFESLDFVQALPAKAVVYDLVYHPTDTALMRAAEHRGLTAVGGLALLVQQAALAAAPGGGELGRQIVALGSPADTGLWVQTSLVKSVTRGSVRAPNGQVLAVELRPGSGGALMSLSAYQALGIGLTELPQMVILGS